jgi:hypothetical protein
MHTIGRRRCCVSSLVYDIKVVSRVYEYMKGHIAVPLSSKQLAKSIL